ncbi:MAG: hypothetical protein HY717_01075, partial [Planctomycetes bacterium]|nr:hypothetical protein [Planctomycetota bacterium]
AGGELEFASSQLAEAAEDFWKARTQFSAQELELSRRLRAVGLEKDVRFSPPEIRPLELPEPDPFQPLALEMAEEITAPPRGQAFDLAELSYRRLRLEGELARADQLGGEEILRRLTLGEALPLALRSLSRSTAPEGLQERVEALWSRWERHRGGLLRLVEARTVGERIALIESMKNEDSWQTDGSDLQSEWESLSRELARWGGLDREFREAFKSSRRLELEHWRRQEEALEKFSGAGGREEDAPLEADLAGWIQKSALKPEDKEKVESSFREIVRELRELREARLEEALARGEGLRPDGLLGERMESDAHGKYQAAVSELARALRRLEGLSGPLYRELAAKFRRAQLARVEKRLENRSWPEGEAAGDPLFREVLSVLRSEASGEGQRELDRMMAKRQELIAFWRRGAEGRRASRFEKDAIARELGERRAERAAVLALEAQRELSGMAAGFLDRPEARPLLLKARSRMAALRRAELEGRSRRLEEELRQAGREADLSPLPLFHRARRVLARIARKERLDRALAPPVQAIEGSLASLKRSSSLFAQAKRSWLEGEGRGWMGDPLEERVRQARELQASSRELSRWSAAFQKSWRDLIRKTRAAGRAEDSIAPSLEERWGEELAEGFAKEDYDGEMLSGQFAKGTSLALRRLLAGEAEEQRALQQSLSVRFSGSAAGGPDLAAALEEAERVWRERRQILALQIFLKKGQKTATDWKRLLSACGRKLAGQAMGLTEEEIDQRASGGDRSRDPAALDQPFFEGHLREVTRREAMAAVKLQKIFAALSRSEPRRFLQWLRDAGLAAPRPTERFAALENLRQEIRDRERLRRDLALDLAAAEAERSAAQAWRRAELAVERVRREVQGELDPALAQEIQEKGFSDRRGRLLNLARLVERDGDRLKKTVVSLSEMQEQGIHLLDQPVKMRELLEFLDLQLWTRVEVLPTGEEAAPREEGAGAGPQLVARAAAFSGVDLSYTSNQALQAMAYCLLQEGQWDRKGLEKAERLLRSFRAHALAREERPGGFMGLPRAFLASSGQVADGRVDAGANALAALACQLHAAVSGSPEFLPLAERIAERVLRPGAEAILAPSSVQPPPAALEGSSLPLAIAVFRNAARIFETVMGDGRGAARCQQAAEGLSRWWIDNRWRERWGLFAGGREGGFTAEEHLLSLAVLARDPRFLAEPAVQKEARGLIERFGLRDSIRERYDSRVFPGNWFIHGLLAGYNRLALPLLSRLEVVPESWPRELASADAWFFLNERLWRWSGGRLGFSARMEGFAADERKEMIDFAATARALWVLSLLRRHVEKSPREGNAEEIYDLIRQRRRQFDESALADERNPYSRGWPLRLSPRRLAGSPELYSANGKLSTEPACYWIFARAADQGLHPFLPERFDKLRKPPPEAAAEPPRREMPAPVRLAALWLEKEIDGTSGLIRANQDPNRPPECNPYAAALAIVHFAKAARFSGGEEFAGQALRLWEAMQKVRDRDGAWADAYDWRSGAVYPGAGNRATGPNSWMALAGLHLYRAAGERRVLDQARETLDWVLSFQEPGGAVTLGKVPLYPKSISTEANADALAAAWGFAVLDAGNPEAQHYRQAARKIAEWLAERMWMPERFLFGTGWSRDQGKPVLEEEWLDSQTWTLLALEAARACHPYDPARHNGLAGLQEKVVNYDHDGRKLQGFSRVSFWPKSFWSEGTAGYVLAARRAGMPVEPFWRSLLLLQAADGSLLHAVGDVPADWPPQHRWKLDLRAPAIDATVWAAWASPEVDFNPFQVEALPPPRAREPDQPPAMDQTREREELRKQIEELERKIDELKKKLGE